MLVPKNASWPSSVSFVAEILMCPRSGIVVRDGTTPATIFMADAMLSVAMLNLTELLMEPNLYPLLDVGRRIRQKSGLLGRVVVSRWFEPGQ